MKTTQNLLNNIYKLNGYFINNYIENISKFSFRSINSSNSSNSFCNNLYKDKSTLVTNYVIDDKISFLNKIVYVIDKKFTLYYCDNIDTFSTLNNQSILTNKNDIKTIRSIPYISNQKSKDLTIYSFFIKDYCYSFTRISDKYIKFKCIRNFFQLLSENINIDDITSFADVNIPSLLEEIHHTKLPKKHKSELNNKLSILDSLLIFQIL